MNCSCDRDCFKEKLEVIIYTRVYLGICVFIYNIYVVLEVRLICNSYKESWVILVYMKFEVRFVVDSEVSSGCF